MALKNACFISYRGSSNECVSKIIAACHRELEAQIGLFLHDAGVYIDSERLKPGDHFNAALATELCQSACMVVLYSPDYFDSSYCAREFSAMASLEAQRRACLPGAIPQSMGMIIPIILRGKDYLPPVLKNDVECVFIEHLVLRAGSFAKIEVIRELYRVAARIYEIHRALRDLDSGLLAACDQFELPTEEDVRPWREALLRPPLGLPGR